MGHIYSDGYWYANDSPDRHYLLYRVERKRFVIHPDEKQIGLVELEAAMLHPLLEPDTRIDFSRG